MLYRLYDFLPSGNGYKVRLILHQLQIPFQRIEMNILKGETRTKEFLAESNAILFYLSQNTPYFPEDNWQKAHVMQWLFFEQYSHEPYIATSRYWQSILGKAEEYKSQLEAKHRGGYYLKG